MTPFIDAHSHVTPLALPAAPGEAAKDRWPCMRCGGTDRATMMVGDKPFRELDARSWDAGRRIEDMDRDGVAMQLLSPMPELLSYWLDPADAALLCDAANRQIADMVARDPRRFRGLGALPLQDVGLAVAQLPRLRREFALSGIEIGSNIGGMMLGDERLDPFWGAAEAEGLAVFVHALHPVAAPPIAAPPLYTALALFPVDVGMAAASLLMAGVADRFPALRIGFSHGGGTIGAMLGRLDVGWRRTDGFQGRARRLPSEQARSLFYDGNVYDGAYLAHLATRTAPGRVFAGTDYPYDIMQTDPVRFVRDALPDRRAFESLAVAAASAFLDEDLAEAVHPRASPMAGPAVTASG